MSTQQEGLFKCGICGQTFTRRQHESRHQRIHTGEKPYKCTHCPEAFSRSDLLNRHISKQHPSVPIIPKRSANCRPGSRKTLDKQPTSKAQRNRDKMVDSLAAATPASEVGNNNATDEEINNFMPTLVGTSAPTTSTDSNYLFNSLPNSWFNPGGNVAPQSPMSIMMASQNQNSLQNNAEYTTQSEQQLDVGSLFNYNDVMSTFLNSPSINIEPNFNTNTLKVSTPSMALESPFEMFERAQGSNVTNDFIAALKRRSSENIQAMSLKIPQNGTFTRLIGGGSHGVSTFKLNTRNMHNKRMSKLARAENSSSTVSSQFKQDSEDMLVNRENDTPTPDFSSSTTLSSPSSSLVTPDGYSKGQAQQAQQALFAIKNLKIKEEKSGKDDSLYNTLFPDVFDPLTASSFLETAV